VKPGYYARVGGINIDEGDGRLSCVLAPIDERHVLAGEIKSGHSGAPVIGAVVTAWPSLTSDSLDDPRQYWLPYAACPTTAEGTFSLAVPPGEDCCLIVRHRSLVHGPRVMVRRGVSWIRLTVAPATPLLVQQKSLVSEPASSGASRCLLVDRERKRTVAWRGRSQILVPGVPPGTYNVFLATPGGGYGQGTVDIELNEPKEGHRVIIGTVPGSWFDGEVVDKVGRPIVDASVRVRHVGWPEEVSNRFGTTQTDSNGGFRVAAGLALSALLEVRVGRQIVATQESDVGEYVRIVCQ